MKKISISSDSYNPLIDIIIQDAKRRGFNTCYFGPKKNEKDQDWTSVTLEAMREIQEGHTDLGPDKVLGIINPWFTNPYISK